MSTSKQIRTLVRELFGDQVRFSFPFDELTGDESRKRIVPARIKPYPDDYEERIEALKRGLEGVDVTSRVWRKKGRYPAHTEYLRGELWLFVKMADRRMQ